MSFPKSFSGGLAVMAFALALGAAAQAESTDATASRPAAVKTAAGQGAARFDWLDTSGKPATPLRVAQSGAPGNGSWICSPSGFGSKSRCYRR